MSLLSDIENGVVSTLNRFVPLPLVGGAGNALKTGVAGVESVPGDIQSAVKDASTVINDAGKGISSIGDFFSYIAWIFHPLNILRSIEFVWGTAIMAFGIWLLTRGGGRGRGASSSIVSRTLSATPAGRIARTRQGTRMGRYEGQRESARMEARQRETRSQREASAAEREQINRNARKAAQ
jgi:hypothetical protein